MPDAPEPRHLCDIFADLAAPIELGEAPRGRRRIIPIVGGRVEGERSRGRVLNPGAGWQRVFADGLAERDTRYAFETHDGAIVEIRDFGFRHGPPDMIAALARGEKVDPFAYDMHTTAVRNRRSALRLVEQDRHRRERRARCDGRAGHAVRGVVNG